MNDLVPDSERTGLIGALPTAMRPYASLMRIDRPIGTWLLYWPCAWSIALAGVRGEWLMFLWFLLGAFAKRSAGCVYNDIVDRNLDTQVQRTRLRPLSRHRAQQPLSAGRGSISVTHCEPPASENACSSWRSSFAPME